MIGQEATPSYGLGKQPARLPVCLCAYGTKMAQIKLWLSIAVLFCAAATFAGAARAETIKLVALGDSLSAGYELPAGQGFPEQLEAALRERGMDVTIVNAGVSGDTSSGALSRLDWAVPDDADGVIVELGANDALRGVDPERTYEALSRILVWLQERELPVLLAGMLAPPNMGADYGKRFDAIYPALAERHDVIFYPFFLDGVAAEPALNLADGMHPNEEGVAVIVEAIMPFVERLIARARERGAG